MNWLVLQFARVLKDLTGSIAGTVSRFCRPCLETYNCVYALGHCILTTAEAGGWLMSSPLTREEPLVSVSFRPENKTRKRTRRSRIRRMFMRFGEQFISGLMRNPNVQGIEGSLVLATLLALTEVFEGRVSFRPEKETSTLS